MKGLKEFHENLQKVKDWTHREIREGLEISANNVVTHAKARHKFGKQLGRETARLHPDERFYTWTSETVNSIQAGEVTSFGDGAMIPVMAGNESMPWVKWLETGRPGARAFPFMGPALRETKSKNLKVMVERIKRVIK